MTIRMVADDQLPNGPWKMIARIEYPWMEVSSRWSIEFLENDGKWEAPGPVAYAAVQGSSGAWYSLEHHYDYPQPGVYVSVPEGTSDSLRAIMEDFGLGGDEVVSMRA